MLSRVWCVCVKKSIIATTVAAMPRVSGMFVSDGDGGDDVGGENGEVQPRKRGRPPKRLGSCSYCRKSGHNRKTCPDLKFDEEHNDGDDDDDNDDDGDDDDDEDDDGEIIMVTPKSPQKATKTTTPKPKKRKASTPDVRVQNKKKQQQQRIVLREEISVPTIRYDGQVDMGVVMPPFRCALRDIISLCSVVTSDDTNKVYKDFCMGFASGHSLVGLRNDFPSLYEHVKTFNFDSNDAKDYIVYVLCYQHLFRKENVAAAAASTGVVAAASASSSTARQPQRRVQPSSPPGPPPPPPQQQLQQSPPQEPNLDPMSNNDTEEMLLSLSYPQSN